VLVGGAMRQRRGSVSSLLSALGFLHDVEPEIRGRISALGSSSWMRFAGFVDDISAVYRDLDLLCFPSHLDAVGRPVLEAAFWAIPGIVAVHDPQPDTFVPGTTGLCVPPGNPQTLADAIAYFHERPGELRRMGEAARHLASRTCDSRSNSARVLEVYRSVLGRGFPVADD
jgi:glycosyltransferase involved in cell wall biosynthesis